MSDLIRCQAAVAIAYAQNDRVPRVPCQPIPVEKKNRSARALPVEDVASQAPEVGGQYREPPATIRGS